MECPASANKISLWLAFSSALAMLLFAGATNAQSLPDGPGKDTVIKLCSNCHDLSVIQTANMSVNGWPGEVQKMMGLGAQGTNDEFKTVVEYLTTYCSTPVSRVAINSASATEIELALQVDHKEALAIVAYRERNGKFKSISQVEKVPGISSGEMKKIEANKDRVTF